MHCKSDVKCIARDMTRIYDSVLVFLDPVSQIDERKSCKRISSKKDIIVYAVFANFGNFGTKLNYIFVNFSQN